MNNVLNLSQFKRGDFYSFSNKTISNETINNKDFSEFFIRHANFLDCTLKNNSFQCNNFSKLYYSQS